jgi:hypothetical protein
VERGTEYERVLKAIADQSGGTFRAISDVDVMEMK